MIKKIKKIHKLGIFGDYTVGADFNDFARFNIFYGWNGCGKTTLSRLFSMLDKKVIDPAFADCQFEVIMDDDSLIKSSNLSAFNGRVFVFNQNFIEENIDWKKQGAKSIIVISEENIVERNKYFQLRDVVIPAKQTLLDNSLKKLAQAQTDRDRFLTASARDIKHSFQLIDTSDSRYMNYDRGKIRNFIEENRESISDPSAILNEQQLSALKQKITPVFKPPVEITIASRDRESFLNQEKHISALLAKEVISEAIERLKANNDINNWVQQGLALHEMHETDVCEFCDQEMPENRITKLKRHFSNEYSVIVAQLNEACEWLEGIVGVSDLPDSAIFYDEFQKESISSIEELRIAEKNLSDVLIHWKEKLRHKLKNIFDVGITLQKTASDPLSAIEKAVKKLNDIVEQHNRKANQFEEQLNEDKSRIELHYVASAVQDNIYFNLLDTIVDEQKKCDDLRKEVDVLEMSKKKMEAELANAAKGAESFNLELHKFLGRTDINLMYDKEEKGYKIMRAAHNKPAQYLSEGEKTAIAFVYFAIKLKENGNNIEDSIVVVDDPISSFDSTYLFNSYAYLKHTCEKARQLFVLTHNFQYFKLVRDWMLNKNKPAAPPKSRAYSIDVLKTGPRQSVLNNAHGTLLNHGSEYHFFFRKLYGFKDTETLDLENAFQVANYARKMLEAFFSFKHPKKRSDFYKLMSTGCEAAGVDRVIVDRIYKFINAYSHNQIVEFHDSTADNLLSEGSNITSDVLHILEKADKVHYDELVEICN